ncbi:hypothetical protein H0X06_06580 [Candidatus Dependentiae bacterium]|nr:hypothetical protein [Candidatus Dependentiae bacterium]
MTMFKNSILLTLLLSISCGATAELSPKHKSLLQCTAQTAGCVISTAATGYVALAHLNGINELGITKYFYSKETWHYIEHIFMTAGGVTCLGYISYRLGKDARKSYRKAFDYRKDSENMTIDENSIDARKSTEEDEKNSRKK